MELVGYSRYSLRGARSLWTILIHVSICNPSIYRCKWMDAKSQPIGRTLTRTFATQTTRRVTLHFALGWDCMTFNETINGAEKPFPHAFVWFIFAKDCRKSPWVLTIWCLAKLHVSASNLIDWLEVDVRKSSSLCCIQSLHGIIASRDLQEATGSDTLVYNSVSLKWELAALGRKIQVRVNQ